MMRLQAAFTWQLACPARLLVTRDQGRLWTTNEAEAGLACRQWVELLLLLCSNAPGTLYSILLAYGQPCTGHNHHSDLPYGLQPGEIQGQRLQAQSLCSIQARGSY